MAFVLVGTPSSSVAMVTTVKVRPLRIGNVNQSFWPTWLSRPAHMPLTGNKCGDVLAANGGLVPA